MIPVTKPYLPDRKTLDKYLDGIYEREWLTNNGQLVQELTARLEEYLGVENLLLVANGTLALQIAYRALGVSGFEYQEQPEAITTPFTFIATASSLKWDGVQPVFADIDPNTWCIDPDNIEKAVTSNTKAIVPVHVFGNACDVDAIDEIARRHQLKVIYDASHAFGVKYKGKSLLEHGDAATLSFHATKLFHTGEGGAIVFKRKEDLERAKKMINFGITGPEKIEELGINAKMNEIQAAMGLSVLGEMHENLAAREAIFNQYKKGIEERLTFQSIKERVSYNYSYFPVLFRSENEVLEVMRRLGKIDVLSRRYFKPSMEEVDCLLSDYQNPISKNISSRILCLPIYSGLTSTEVNHIVNTVMSVTS
ncbi:DegT/DnrJ/EryC1/StrS family aminotransferase [Alcanivorax sp.]|jgi:dTDP-4-amino-4,6-dideoxygalactose transaminase|uniref:DegT/DnrJ/EryC1/StrS family aminotransferase n=1 Tax=Alcanivorax sp. TaxID=1872427 RepID=UPI0032D9029D